MNFNDWVDRGVARYVASDISRANSLRAESQNRYNFLKNIRKQTVITVENANYFVELGYDIIMSLLRAKLCDDGYTVQGESAHEAEISYVLDLGFGETDQIFLNELRYFRNGIKYYGKTFSPEYAEKVIVFVESCIKRL